MTMGDGVSRAGFHTIAAKDAAVVVDIVDLGVPLAPRDAHRVGVLCRLDIDAI